MNLTINNKDNRRMWLWFYDFSCDAKESQEQT